MTTPTQNYRLVPIGKSSPDDVTVGIEEGPDGRKRAAVWWEARGDVDADEAEYDDVPQAFTNAEAARALYGFNQVVVVLARPELWDSAWGTLQQPDVDKEPIGDIEAMAISSDEAFNLAAGIEEERDA